MFIYFFSYTRYIFLCEKKELYIHYCGVLAKFCYELMISIVLAKFDVWECLGDVQLVQSANFWLMRIRINRRSAPKLGQFQRDQMILKSRFLRIKKTELEASSLTWEPCPRWLHLHLWPVLTATSRSWGYQLLHSRGLEFFTSYFPHFQLLKKIIVLF